jgi:peptidoglycan/LPS O-acetylase OafA/YrhL
MRGRNLQLDILRCAAILGVLVAHATTFREPHWWWDRRATGPSWTGVDLFFVISGFLISGLLFSEFQKRGRIDFGRFAVRRALKLYPMLYILVLGVLAVRLVQGRFHGISVIVWPAVHDLFFVQSYFRGTYGHFWSLAVEEHFYILLPVMLYIMLRMRRPGDLNPFRKLPLVFGVVAIFSLAARLVHAILVQPYSHETHLFPTHFRLDSLFFGVLLSYWLHFYPDGFAAWTKRLGPFLLPVSILLILPAVFLPTSSFFIYTAGLTFLYLGYGGILIAFLQVPISATGAGRWLKPLSYVGQHSYPIYLFHILILETLSTRGLLQGWRGVVLYFTSTIAIGILLSKLIEFPVLRLRDRLFPRREGMEALPGEHPANRLRFASWLSARAPLQEKMAPTRKS